MIGKQKQMEMSEGRKAQQRIDPRYDSAAKGFDQDRAEMPYILRQLHEASKIKRRELHYYGSLLRQGF